MFEWWTGDENCLLVKVHKKKQVKKNWHVFTSYLHIYIGKKTYLLCYYISESTKKIYAIYVKKRITLLNIQMFFL